MKAEWTGVCLCAVLSALSVHGETANRSGSTVAELRPDGTNDMTAAVMAAVDRARAAGGGRIAFAPGEYHFKSPRQMSFYVSNHDNPMPRNVFLPVTNLVGVTLESSAARFVCHGEGIACALIDTDAVTVKGIAFDYFRPYFTEWRLRGGKLTTDKQAYPYEIDAEGKIVSAGPGWREKQTLAAFFDRLSRVYLGCEWWDGRADHRFTKYPEGTVVVTRNGYRPNPCVFLYRAKDSVFEECGAYSSGGMGLIAQRSENVRIAGWRTRRDRFTGLQADATHFSNCRGLVSVTDSLFEGMVDDAINVHSTCLKIVEKKGDRTIVCQYMHKQSVGFEVFLAGETLRFIKGATLEPGAEVRVADAKPLAFDRVELTLDGAMPESYGVGDAVENADWQPAVVFSRNMVRNSSPRATLFTTPGRIVCESNVFEHVAGQPILLAGDAWDWYESGACRDVTIRGNVFDGCARTGGKGMVQITPAVHDLAAQKERYHRNILVEDNLFRDYRVPLVFGHSADNLVLRGNRIVNGNTNVVLTGSDAVTNDGGRPLKVLMVGNSFSESVLVELPNVVRATGNRLVLVNLMIGGCPLRRHWNNYLQSEADPKFRPYTVEVNWEGEKKVANTPLAKVAPYVHATLQDVVRAEKWDLITVQQASPDSWKQETYQPYADNLIAKLRELAPQAEIRVHQTWAYNVQEGIDQRMMYEGIVQSYGELAAAHGFAVIPVGEAIQRYRKELPVTFLKRLDAAAVKAVPTDVLPDTGGEPVGFFYWNTGRPWEKRDPKGDYRLRWDGCHLNPEGKYLQALVWYASVFGGDPRKVAYAPEKLDAHRAEVMRACAAKAVGL